MVQLTTQDWMISLEDNPQDRDLRLVYSDWLEEQGQQEEAEAWRLLIEKGYSPCDRTDHTVPAWCYFLSDSICSWRRNSKKQQNENSIIPNNIFDFLNSRHEHLFTDSPVAIPTGVGFKTFQQAENAMVQAILHVLIKGETVE